MGGRRWWNGGRGRTKGEIHKADSRKRDGGRGVEKKKGEERNRERNRWIKFLFMSYLSLYIYKYM